MINQQVTQLSDQLMQHDVQKSKTVGCYLLDLGMNPQIVVGLASLPECTDVVLKRPTKCAGK